MRKEPLNPIEIYELVEWPESYKSVDDELVAARKRIVIVFVDRINRGTATGENKAALTEARARMRQFYNPDGVRVVIRPEGKTGRMFDRAKGGVNAEMKVIFKALSNVLGETIESELDLLM